MEGEQNETNAATPGATCVYIPPANLPPPKPLVMDANLAINWKTWKKAWSRYEIATGVAKQSALVGVSTLLSIIGEDATKVFETFQWNEEENEEDPASVIAKFDAYCEPRTQVIYERYRFNNRKQERGEYIVTYLTKLKTIAKNCKHDEITADEILRDRIVLGIRDDKIRERLLRCNDLTLQKAIDIVKAAEQTEQQVKNMKDENQVNSLKNRHKHDSLTDVKQSSFDKSGKGTKIDCGSCGRKHARKDCPAFGKTCRKCGKRITFKPNVAVKRCQRSTKYQMTTMNFILASLARTRRPHAKPIKL